MREAASLLSPQALELVEPFDVGGQTAAFVSVMREPVQPGEIPSTVLLAGDVLRRTCRLGGKVCAADGCQAPEDYDNSIEKQCSDMNLAEIVDSMGIPRERFLMVGVTDNNVGFASKLKTMNVKTNSVGIREVAGYNAFFARESDNIVLGARLADCGYAAIEFKNGGDENVHGFVHLTRTNMQGESALAFEVNGQPAGSFEYFIHEALREYGGKIPTLKVHTVAAIKAENYEQTFKDEDGSRPEDRFPGWFAQGMLKNVTNPIWQPGDPINPDNQWRAEYREMVRWQVMRSGINPKQLDESGMIDPGDLELGHASNHAGAHGKMPDGRDAYLVVSKLVTQKKVDMEFAALTRGMFTRRQIAAMMRGDFESDFFTANISAPYFGPEYKSPDAYAAYHGFVMID